MTCACGVSGRILKDRFEEAEITLDKKITLKLLNKGGTELTLHTSAALMCKGRGQARGGRLRPNCLTFDGYVEPEGGAVQPPLKIDTFKPENLDTTVKWLQDHKPQIAPKGYTLE